MSHRKHRRIQDQINLLRNAPSLPFGDILDPSRVQRALSAENVGFRVRLFTPLITLWTFLSQVLSQDHSCREAVDRLIAYQTARGQRPCRPETGTYCKARKRLPLGVLRRLVHQSGDDLDQCAPKSWLWKGRHVCLVDGTTVSMPDTAANQKAFPQPSAQAPGVGFPLARVVAVISLATGALRDLAIGPYKGKETGETALFRTLLDRLACGLIILGDRFFSSYFGIAALRLRRIDGLFRMHQLRKFDFHRGRLLGIEDHVVRWAKPPRPKWMDESTYDQFPSELEVRELRVHVKQPGFRAEEIVLVTTMLDEQEYPKEDLAALFLDRWNIELDLRSIKCVMQMEILRCKSPAMVEKEVWMHMLAYNLIRVLMASAAEAHATEPRRLSFKGTLQALSTFRESIELAPWERRPLLVEELLRAIASYEVKNRFGRVEPRAIKRRPKQNKLLQEPRFQARKRLIQQH